MTRLRKVDPQVLEHEYIYDSAPTPISFNGLAKKHGLAKNTVAEKAAKGHWFRRREEFRKQLGVKTVEALGEQWVRFETAAREKALSIGVKLLDKYDKQLDDPEFKVSTRDMVGVVAMMRTLAADAAAKTNGEEVLLDANSIDLDPALARQLLDHFERSDAETPAPGPAEPRPD